MLFIENIEIQDHQTWTTENLKKKKMIMIVSSISKSFDEASKCVKI